MPINKHHNNKYSGGLPIALGDRYYGQDLFRDIDYLLDKSGLTLRDMLNNFPVKLSGGVVTQGTGDTLNITPGYGYAEYEVDVPDDFGAATPPAVIQQDIEAIRIAWTQQTNLVISSATLDGVTVNYVKIAYNGADLNTRDRAKATGSYAYELTPSFLITVDSTPSTDKEVLLATFTGSGGGSFTFMPLEPAVDFQSNIGVQSDIKNWYAPASVAQIGKNSAIYGTTSLGASSYLALANNSYADIFGTNRYISTDEASILWLAHGGLQLTIAASGTAETPISLTTSFQIFSSHDVATFGLLKLGILDTSPNDKVLFFHTEGSSPVYFDTFNILRQAGPNGGTFFSHRGTGAVTMQAIEAAPLLFKTTSLERFRILADGKLSTGAEAAPDCSSGGLTLRTITAADAQSFLTVKGNGFNHGMTGVAETDTAIEGKIGNLYGNTSLTFYGEVENPCNIISYSTGANNVTGTTALGAISFNVSQKSGTTIAPYPTGGNLFVIKATNTTRYLFKADGNAYADVNWLTFSDKRLKKEIKQIEYGLTEVLRIMPQQYKKYSGALENGIVTLENKSERNEIGFLAQDVYEHMPEAVAKPDDETNSFWGISNSNMVPVLWRAVQQEDMHVKENKFHIKQIADHLGITLA